MKLFLLPVLLLSLASCDTTEPNTATTLPHERALVMWNDDSLLAVQVGLGGQLGRELSVSQGQIWHWGGFTTRNELLESGRLLAYAQDRSGRTAFPGRLFVEVLADEPTRPVLLGRPGEGFMAGYVSPTNGQTYGLRRDGNGEQWTVLRIERTTSVPVVTTSAIGPEDWPQALLVSDDEQVAAVAVIRRPDRTFGEPQDLIVLRPGHDAPAVVPDAALNVYDLRYVEATDRIYFVDFYTGIVSGVDPEAGTRETLLGPLRHHIIGGRRLFVLDGGLVTFRRNEFSTSIYRYDLGTGAVSEFTLPVALTQAYEHGGYVMFRAFDRAPTEGMTGPIERFVGICASALTGPPGPLTPAETFQVPIPYFARQLASLSHSFRCENGVPI